MNRLRTTGLLVTALLVAMLALAGAASAHVTVSAPGATRGGSDQPITFQVPNEANVDTVGLTVVLPTDTPLSGVLVQPMAGWRHTQKITKLAKPIQTDDGDITSAVSQITWTATGRAGIKPGEFGAFTIIAGSLPDTDSLTFKALERYRNGHVVRWIEQAAPGSSAEPQNPAPQLSLAASGPRDGASLVAADSGGSTTTTVLSVLALALAAAALGLAVVTRAKVAAAS